MSEKDIRKLREKIDALDDELLGLLERRRELARDVGKLKGKAPAYRPERESEILRRMPEASRGVFREVISSCRAVEQAISVSYLGPQGTFEVIFEVFNVTNSDNFLAPAGSSVYLNFDGTLRSGLGAPRQFQVGGRWLF